MPKTEVLRSREFGLALGLIFGRYALNMQDLHYGYWEDDLDVQVHNLPEAQARYTEVLMSKIPEGVKTILDVGCGAGNTAKKLLDRGYQVDCVSPNPHLTKIARELLGDRAQIYECKFEELQTDRTYDLILFSESFLFINAEVGLKQATRLLNPNGHLLITDVFKIVPDGISPIGGGHQLEKFYNVFNQSTFTLKEEQDITSKIAPTFTVLDDAYKNCLKPAYELIRSRLISTHPWIMKFLQWKFRTKIERIEKKHFGGQRTAESFAKYKSYRLFLYHKSNGIPSTQ